MGLLESLLASRAAYGLVETSLVGHKCYIKPWSDADRLEWVAICKAAEESGEPDLLTRARAIAYSLVDADGTLIFGVEKTNEVAKFSSDEIDRLWDEVISVQKRAEEAAEKN